MFLCSQDVGASGVVRDRAPPGLRMSTLDAQSDDWRLALGHLVGDKSAVEGFQAITNLIIVSAQDAIDGDPAMRALVPHAAHLWQYTDAKPTHAAYQLWERERVGVFGEDVTHN